MSSFKATHQLLQLLLSGMLLILILPSHVITAPSTPARSIPRCLDYIPPWTPLHRLLSGVEVLKTYEENIFRGNGPWNTNKSNRKSSSGSGPDLVRAEPEKRTLIIIPLIVLWTRNSAIATSLYNLLNCTNNTHRTTEGTEANQQISPQDLVITTSGSQGNGPWNTRNPHWT